MVTVIADEAAAARLAARILAPGRTTPIVVVTTRFGSPEPLIDIAAFAEALRETADVALIVEADLTRAFAAHLPAECAVFNGAIRTYPLGTDWHERPWLARRRFSYDDAHAPALAERAIDDATAAAHRDGFQVSTPAATTRALGSVVSILEGGERAVVRLDSGRVASVAQHAGIAPAPLDWALEPGQRVSGDLDDATGRLRVDVAIAGADELWARYPPGSVILALVDRVERQRATLVPHPGVIVAVGRADLSSNPRDRVDLLLTEGDVIEVRVVRDEQGRITLRTIDLDDDEQAMDAHPVIAGGPPWLRPGRPLPGSPVDDLQLGALLGDDAQTPPSRDSGSEVPRDVSVDEPAGMPATVRPPRPAPGPGARPAVPLTAPSPSGGSPLTAAAQEGPPPAAAGQRAALKSALDTVARLKAELETLKSELRRARGSNSDARIAQLESVVRELAERHSAGTARAQQAEAKIRDLQSSLRQARRVASGGAADGVAALSPADRRDMFTSAEEWVRHEMYVLWVERLDAATRAEHPWPAPVAIGERFADSIEALPAAKHEKALRCAMEAVCGLIEVMPAREVHALRSGDGATTAPVVRSDGARCKRAYVEQKTPQALRLHYWVLPGGGIELSRVVAHDDIEP